jgi:cytochrome c biogenesis protein CcmG/thiol:disulfide interchange protein DsbE
LPSTPSSANGPDGNVRRPSRAAIAVLALVSLAIPAGALALIVAHTNERSGSPAGSGAPGSATDSAKARIGTHAPDFTLPSTTGTNVTLSALRGHPVVIAFFASWCHPCQEELPVLQHFARDDATRLRVIGVNYDDLPSDTANFVRQLRVTFPALLEDPSGPVADRYGVLGIPQTVFVDAHGIVRGRVYGQTSQHALQPAIEDILRGIDIRPV